MLHCIGDISSHSSYLIEMFLRATDISNGHFAGVRDKPLKVVDALVLRQAIVTVEAELVELLRRLFRQLTAHLS